jgi:hypothetical protein
VLTPCHACAWFTSADSLSSPRPPHPHCSVRCLLIQTAHEPRQSCKGMRCCVCTPPRACAPPSEGSQAERSRSQCILAAPHVHASVVRPRQRVQRLVAIAYSIPNLDQESVRTRLARTRTEATATGKRPSPSHRRVAEQTLSALPSLFILHLPRLPSAVPAHKRPCSYSTAVTSLKCKRVNQHQHHKALTDRDRQPRAHAAGCPSYSRASIPSRSVTSSLQGAKCSDPQRCQHPDSCGRAACSSRRACRMPRPVPSSRPVPHPLFRAARSHTSRTHPITAQIGRAAA